MPSQNVPFKKTIKGLKYLLLPLPLSFLLSLCLVLLLPPSKMLATTEDLKNRHALEVSKPSTVWVEVIKGTVRSSPTNQGNPVGVILPHSGNGVAVQEGSYIKCVDGGKALAYLYQRTQKYTKPEWSIIPATSPTKRTSLSNAYAAAARTGAVTRSSQSILFSPVNGEVVAPSSLIFLWKPVANASVDLTFSDARLENPMALWSQKNIKGNSGRLISKEASDYLRRWLSNEGPDAPLQVKLVEHVSDEQSIVFEAKFTVMTSMDEEKMLAQISAWNHDNQGTMQLFGCAGIYYDAGCLAASAEEYAAASRSLPESQMLRRRSIEAYKMIGDESISSAPDLLINNSGTKQTEQKNGTGVEDK